MLLTHFHLMFNHLPIFGSVVLFFLMVHAVYFKKEKQVRIYLWSYILVAVVTIPVFLTGDPSGDLIKKLPGISESTTVNIRVNRNFVPNNKFTRFTTGINNSPGIFMSKYNGGFCRGFPFEYMEI